jgi:hypothetical protein
VNAAQLDRSATLVRPRLNSIAIRAAINQGTRRHGPAVRPVKSSMFRCKIYIPDCILNDDLISLNGTSGKTSLTTNK